MSESNLVGTFWKCTSPALEQYGRYCVVKEAETNPDYNGDGDVKVLYSNGDVHYMKLRRFYSRHVRLYYMKHQRHASMKSTFNMLYQP